MKNLLLKRSDLTYEAALRGPIFMLPMVIAMILGKEAWIVPLGQGGFFFSIMPHITRRVEAFSWINNV